MRSQTCLALLSVLWGFFAVGCISMANFQEVDTLPAGEQQLGAGVTYTQAKWLDGSPMTMPALNVWYRLGVIEDVEAHCRVWLPLGVTTGGKFQILGDRARPGFGLSAGVDVGYLEMEIGDTKLTIVDTYVPVYAGYRIGPGLSFYVTPKYVLRAFPGTEDAGLTHMVGGTVGMQLGPKTPLFVEGSGMMDIAGGPPILSGGIGIDLL